ncbi:S41 family peptidase [Pedobacter montanisoli]|uniref:S41 family peptidase n=1 Tax=Pedobacter montanisoli TaxID=2923277 RepID=A0ABS9ZXT5_9SPHI|nr:S41 family peptidase [Pedobacter montanisoli]MCJ0743132.1 S41 family peptidase [Pedobacter montanisoli]
MKKIIVLIFFTLIAHFGFAQSLSKADFIEDLEFLKKTLPIKHTNLFAKITQANFKTKVDAVISKAGALDYETFTTELFKLMVSIGDEHTFVEPKFTKILPIQFELFKEGLFVTGIDEANSDLLQAKLIAINNQSTANVISLFKEIIQSENQSYFDDHLLHYINNPAFLKGLGIINSDDEAEFTLIDKNNKQVKIKLAAIKGNDITDIKLAFAQVNLLSKKEKGNYWFNYDPDRKVLYFNYNKCQEEQDVPFSKFNDELFAFITQHKPEKIILDLRYNNGGNSGVLTPFIEKIKDSYFNQKGKFFVLIGKKTFSSAVMNAVDLKRNTNAFFIGEPTSGNINHYGEVRGFSLPKTKIVIAYSTRYWETWKGKKGPLKPDVDVKYSIKNFIEGKDEALMQVYKNKSTL